MRRKMTGFYDEGEALRHAQILTLVMEPKKP